MLTVFVGPSGCGKGDDGAANINRMVIRPEHHHRRRQMTTGHAAEAAPGNFAYVIQNAGLMPHQRVNDNVATVPVPAAAKAGYEVLERAGLTSRSPPLPRPSSGGEQHGTRGRSADLVGRTTFGRRPGGSPRAGCERNTSSALDKIIRLREHDITR